ncbi:hypothetical protein, partial [Neobacillus thermocopriae]|uniref:hypothetical protein n=1 Tax=Neobacillus thermocopriae TaxID=1215031 RepID=UPI0037706B99
AWAYAYFGGRIEQLKLGTFPKVFAYDINSAYPTGITKLPQCVHSWQKVKWNPEKFKEPYYYFSVWKVTYDYDTYLPIF